MTNIFSTLFQRTQQRRAYSDLLRLDDRLLRDMGLTRSDVHQMMSRRRKGGSTNHE